MGWHRPRSPAGRGGTPAGRSATPAGRASRLPARVAAGPRGPPAGRGAASADRVPAGRVTLGRVTRLLRPPLRVFHGWWVVAGAMGMQAMQALLFFQSFGVYAPFWMAEFGWSRTTVSLIHSLHRTESGLLGPIHGWLLQRFGARRVVVGGMLLFGAGFVGLGLVRGLAQFVAAFMLMAVGASLCGFMSLMTMVVNWFERRRARAMALVGLGMSLGGLLVPALAWLLVTYGWRAVAIGSGVLYWLLAWPLSRVFVDDPESVGLRPDGDDG